MTGHATPPDQTARIRELETRVENLSRAQNPVKPNLFDIADVSGMPATTGQTLIYNRDTGQWEPGLPDAFSPGDVKWSASTSAPAGRWLGADGAAVSRTTYDDLFAAIGTTYGAGNGSTTFNVPNLQSRFIIGVGTDTLATTGGSRNAIAVSHTHTTGHAATSAEVSGYGLPPNDQDVAFENRVRVNRATGVGTGDVTDSTGSSGTNANLPPYIALYGWIRY